MVQDNLDFQLRSIKVGLFMKSLYVLLEFYIQDSLYFMLNIYVPNKCSEQHSFFKEISEILKAVKEITQFSSEVILTSYMTLTEMDGAETTKRKGSAKLFEDMHLDFDLVDICRVRNHLCPGLNAVTNFTIFRLSFKFNKICVFFVGVFSTRFTTIRCLNDFSAHRYEIYNFMLIHEQENRLADFTKFTKFAISR